MEEEKRRQTEGRATKTIRYGKGKEETEERQVTTPAERMAERDSAELAKSRQLETGGYTEMWKRVEKHAVRDRAREADAETGANIVNRRQKKLDTC